MQGRRLARLVLATLSLYRAKITRCYRSHRVGAHATRRLPAKRQRGPGKEASMLLSWVAVSWTVARLLVIWLALLVLAVVGIEVALFLMAAAFLY